MKISLQVIRVFLILAFLSACGSKPTQTPTLIPSVIPTLIPTQSETPSPPPVPTATPTATFMPTLQIPEDAMVAYYPFDGDAEDASGFHNDGTLYGPVLTFDRFGRPDRAYYFDGNDDYIEIQVSDSLKFPYSYSMALWLAPESDRGVQLKPLLSYKSSWSFRFDRRYEGNSLAFYSTPNVAGSTSETTTGSLPDGRWTCAVFTYNAADTTWTFYLNGQVNSQGKHNHWIGYTSGRIIIGGQVFDTVDPTAMFQGSIDDVSIYTRALSTEEAWNYCANYPGGEEYPLASYPTTSPPSTSTPTPTPTISLCLQGWSHLRAGMQAILTPGGKPNRLRDFPYVPEVPTENTIALLEPGTVVRVLQGPECRDGLVFWKVEVLVNGATLTGWTAEGDGTEYWLRPIQP